MRRCWIVFTLAVGTLTAMLGAQQQPSITADAGLIRRHVTVRDAQGRHVPNLTADDFTIAEDGVAQAVTTFREADASARLVLLFIDDMHVAHSDTLRVRQVLQLLRDRLVKDTDLIGIVSTGQSSIQTDVVHDYGYRRLNMAIERMMGSATPMAHALSGSASPQQVAVRRLMVHTALRTMRDQLARVRVWSPDRQPVLLYVSSGFDLNPVRDADLVAEVAELVGAASRTAVTIYPIDPRGPVVEDMNRLDGVPIADYRAYVEKSTSVLRSMATDTGGRCVCGSKDLAEDVEAIDRETNRSYTLTYRSTNTDPQRVVRQISIRTRRPGLTLAYQDRYAIEK